MICDAHIHVGYFNRTGFDAPFYYSPRRVCSVLRRCGVHEFIFSSTSMQTRGIVFGDVHKEAQEMVKIWGRDAHPFLWVTKAYLDYDPKLSCLDGDLYEGLKLHGRETPWLSRKMVHLLERVLDIASVRKMPVVVHTGLDAASHPLKWLEWAKRYGEIRFDYAHCAPAELAQRCIEESSNVFVDLSCVADDEILKMQNMDLGGRVLWGSDFPTVAAKSGLKLTHDMHLEVERYNKLEKSLCFEGAFRLFLGKCA